MRNNILGGGRVVKNFFFPYIDRKSLTKLCFAHYKKNNDKRFKNQLVILV